MRDIVAATIDLLTVATHSILYYRSIYPKTSFIFARKYNFPVPQNRHPMVCEWINGVISEIEQCMLRNAISRVVLLIYHKQSGEPLERFVLDISHLPSVPEDCMDMVLEGQLWNSKTSSILPIVDMEECLRAVMSKLEDCCSSLPPLMDESTFTLTMETDTAGSASLNQMESWLAVPASDSDASSTTPPVMQRAIRHVVAGLLILNSWYEVAGTSNWAEHRPVH